MLQHDLLENESPIINVNGETIYSDEYEKILTDIDNLPASKKVDDILYALDESPIIMVRGETGSGKSTQIPKILWHRWTVIETQPRVSAAVNLAGRIAKEMVCETLDPRYALWNEVWYKTGRWVSSKHLSNISIHTDALELMRLSNGGKIPDYMVLDEFHTDSIPTATLAMVLREELLKFNKQFKLIITSATIDTLKTLDYFAEVTKDMPIIDIKGRTFPVEKTFAKEHEFGKYIEEYYEKWHSILVFEQWIRDIKDTIDEIKMRIGSDIQIYPFHSELSVDEQREIVNKKLAPGEQVIIVATNSAEESLTVSYIDTVIDKWNHKVATTNKYGVQRLDSEPVSKANFKQRAGRAWRVKNGHAIRTNSHDYDSLPDFPDAPIKSSTLEREILSLLKQWINVADELVKHYGKNTKLFIDNPSDTLVKLSYERLYRLWAIDANGITELGERLLQFPLSVFNARILVEAIDRWVSKDVIEMVAILENKWFLNQDGIWKDLYDKSKWKSDLFFMLKLFRDLSSSNLNESTLNFLWSKGGFSFSKIEHYKNLRWEQKFYEVMESDDLENFWVNKRSLERINDTLLNLKQRFSDNELSLTDSWNNDDILISLLSGNLDNIFNYDPESKTFYNAFLSWKNLNFTQWASSVLDLDRANKKNHYIWVPFIIGGQDERDDFNLLHSISIVTDYHIWIFKELLTKKIPDFNFRKNTELQLARKEYLATLAKVKGKTNMSVSDINGRVTQKIIRFLEWNSKSYSDLIIFLKNIAKDKKFELKEEFKQYFKKKDEYYEFKKQLWWISTFLNDLEKINSWKDINLEHITLWVCTNEQSLLTDPIVREYNFSAKVKDLVPLIKDINKIRSFLTEREQKDLNKNLQKIFSSSKKKFRVVAGNLERLVSKIETKIHARNVQIDDYREKAEKEFNGKPKFKTKIQTLLKENKKLMKAARSISSYVEQNKAIRDDIDSIDFKNVLYTESKKDIFTEKYLYNILRNVIFSGSYIHLYNKVEEKLTDRLHKYLWDTLSQDDIVTLVNALKNYNSSSQLTAGKALKIIQDYTKDVQAAKQRNQVIDKEMYVEIESLYKWDIDFLISSIKSLLWYLFEEEYIEQNMFKIVSFARKIPNLTIRTFDKELEKFLLQFSFKQFDKYSYAYVDVFFQKASNGKDFEFKRNFYEVLDDYLYWDEFVREYHASGIKKEIQANKLSPTEIDQQRANLQDAITKLWELKQEMSGYKI